MPDMTPKRIDKIAACLSSEKDDWGTPQWLFDALDQEFHFDLDPCSSDENHKCQDYYTEKDDGLTKDWSGRIVFTNPPYSRGGLAGKWCAKARHEAETNNALVVCLVKASTGSKWFRSACEGAEVRFITGRLKFEGGEAAGSNAAPFDSALIIYRPGLPEDDRVGRLQWHG